MIPIEFEYYKPDSLKEALDLFETLQSEEKKPIYYAGGTEIITMSRAHEIDTKAIIDIKGIPECNVYEIKDDKLYIGAAITLTQIAEKNLFPLLSLAAKRIADHTNQDRITLGGNISGTIIYNETVLPLLVSNSEALIANSKEIKQTPFTNLFDKGIQLHTGDLVVQSITDTKYLNLPFIHAKRTKNEKIAYPLISMAALKEDGKVNIAFSGLCHFPFRSTKVEEFLNDKNKPFEENYQNILNNLPDKVLTNITGSSDFRKYMLNKMLIQTLKNLEVY